MSRFLLVQVTLLTLLTQVAAHIDNYVPEQGYMGKTYGALSVREVDDLTPILFVNSSVSRYVQHTCMYNTQVCTTHKYVQHTGMYNTQVCTTH